MQGSIAFLYHGERYIYILSFTGFNLKIKISTRLYSRVLILIFKLKSVNDNMTRIIL